MAKPAVADIGLILEGTYPYVLGGVSAWVDQIIRGLPELTFSLFYIGAQEDPDAKLHYELPANVLGLTKAYLHERLPPAQLEPGRPEAALRARIFELLTELYRSQDRRQSCRVFWQLLECLRRAGPDFTFGNLARDREAWAMQTEICREFCPEESFIDFFWSSRFLHLPIWRLWLATPSMPAARAYHSVSAGYAGLAGAIAARAGQVPFLLTEHGIYTKERMTEISQADWIYEDHTSYIDYSLGLGSLKRMWINLFMLLGYVSYDSARRILTLYQGNADVEIEFGAEPDKIEIVPNGIDPARFDSVRATVAARWNPAPAVKRVGFLGRVVPIKDVKTLLRAARLVCEALPATEFLIAGPYAEDPAYFEDCKKIVTLLGIEQNVRFLGPQKLMEVLPSMDLMVLTSISEGLPLVVLEAMAAGIPLVATDVGACRELIFGGSPPDKALGRAGCLTKILSPQETASGILHILNHPEVWKEMGAVGRRRVERHYTMSGMLARYRALYQAAIEAGSGAAGNVAGKA